MKIILHFLQILKMGRREGFFEKKAIKKGKSGEKDAKNAKNENILFYAFYANKNALIFEGALQ